MCLPLPGDEGDKFSPKGYTIPEVGPLSVKGKGRDFFNAEKERVGKVRGGGCPFARVKAE